jgi:hypothetical protein
VLCAIIMFKLLAALMNQDKQGRWALRMRQPGC